MQSLSCALLLAVAAALVEGGKYDYADALHKGLLFYQGERSGKLSGMDPLMSWRKDSCLNDKGLRGEDLTGGYFDAGDFVKFGHPMAFTVTVLSWGLLEYEQGYQQTGQVEEVRAAIKWGTDYFIKAHVSKFEFYGQVGSGPADHEYWGRPEDYNLARPAFLLDPQHPGSDLVGETAAAMAAASLVFKDVDPSYSATLLKHARELYEFAETYQGLYTVSIPDSAACCYNSTGYEDELSWAALWMFRATGEKTFLEKGDYYYDKNGFQYWGWPLAWDSKAHGATTMLAKYSENPKYKPLLENFCDEFYYKYKRTPQGLVFVHNWGALRLASNGAFTCFQASDLGIKTDEYRAQGKKQIDYMLGDTGHSFVVGFGNNPPTHAHHRSASCPDAPATCDWNTYNGKQDNYHVIYGALVGGPGANDDYTDDRTNWEHNEVGCDYNAAFTGNLAAIITYGL